jgi:hypothetical protein
MPPSREEWAGAYARQSQSDFAMDELLSIDMPKTELCHRLHYLQMACEKIAKAFRFRDTTASVDDLLTSHVAFSRCIENILRSPDIKRRYKNRPADLRRLLGRASSIAREIEKLAPAVDRDQSPQNTEYPWEDNGKAITPCGYSFPNLQILFTVRSFPLLGGRDFLILVKTIIHDFELIRLA